MALDLLSVLCKDQYLIYTEIIKQKYKRSINQDNETKEERNTEHLYSKPPKKLKTNQKKPQTTITKTHPPPNKTP